LNIINTGVIRHRVQVVRSTMVEPDDPTTCLTESLSCPRIGAITLQEILQVIERRRERRNFRSSGFQDRCFFTQIADTSERESKATSSFWDNDEWKRRAACFDTYAVLIHARLSDQPTVT
jgi:hypothetical protein